MSKIPCIYCSTDHTYVCDCGRSHSDHTPGGGCAVTKCERYSQQHQRLPQETTKDFNDRILGKKKVKR